MINSDRPTAGTDTSSTPSATDPSATDPSVTGPQRGDLSSDGLSFYDGEGWGWQPLWLSQSDVVSVAHELFGATADAASFLADGFLNQSWRLSCADHDRVLRVSRPERTLDQLRYEYRVSSAWAARLPAVLLAEHSPGPCVDGHQLTMFPYLTGVSGHEVSPKLRMTQLAPLLATMHRVSLGLSRRQRPGYHAIDDRVSAPDGSEGPWRVEEKWAAARHAVVERFGSGHEVSDVIAYVDDAVGEITQDLSRWTQDGRLRCRAVVHADLNPRNQLYRDDRLIGVIDTDECRVEPLIAEVAGLAYSDPAVDPAEAWRAYRQAGGPLPDEDEELLLTFARLGSLGELEWITDEHGVATHLALGNLANIAADLGRPIRG